MTPNVGVTSGHLVSGPGPSHVVRRTHKCGPVDLVVLTSVRTDSKIRHTRVRTSRRIGVSLFTAHRRLFLTGTAVGDKNAVPRIKVGRF